jgi:hypothetical protein
VANFSSNPWSLVSTDPATATITGATGLTLNADGTVTITTTGALTFNATAESNLAFVVINATNPLYNGAYGRISGASGASSFVMQPRFVIPSGTAQSGAGTLAQCIYRSMIRVEDISWQNASAAGQLLDLRDADGNIVWQATATAAGSQNRGKVFWIEGLTPITIGSGVVLLTVN